MLGRRLSPPASTRLTYCGSRNTPCASAPVRSASVISSATRAASSAGISTARRASRMKARIAGAGTRVGPAAGVPRAAVVGALIPFDYRITPGNAPRGREPIQRRLTLTRETGLGIERNRRQIEIARQNREGVGSADLVTARRRTKIERRGRWVEAERLLRRIIFDGIRAAANSRVDACTTRRRFSSVPQADLRPEQQAALHDGKNDGEQS